MNDSGARYYYSRLTDNEREIYESICKALLSFEPALTLRHAPIGNMQKILKSVLFDNPVFFYLNRKRVAVLQNPFGLTLVFQYDYSRPDAEAMWQTAQIRLDRFMERCIKPNMNSLAKQIEAHRWMQQNIKIAKAPYGRECFSLVGALVKGCCVCEGFAHGYKLICDRMHIASIIVTGTAINADGTREAHAWNITRIDGVTAHIDVTWDTIYGVGSYDYFNLSDDEIAADHIYDRSLYPRCEKNNINYFKLNKLVAYNKSELCSIIANNRQREFFSVKLEFQCDAGLLSECGFPSGRLRYNAARNIVSFAK